MSGGRGRDNRQFVNAVVYRVRTGCSWRDLPERFGPWNTVPLLGEGRRGAGLIRGGGGAGLRLGAGRFNHREGPQSRRRAKKAQAARRL